MEAPEINVDEERVEKIVKKSGKKIATKAKANYKKFPKETEKCGTAKEPTAFVVPEVEDMTLEHGKAEKKDFVKASVLSAAGGPVKDEITNEVWRDMKPELSAQLPGALPSSVKNKALNKCRDAVLKPMVSKAIDKVLHEIIEKMNNKPDGEGDEDGDEDEEKDDNLLC